MLLPYWTNANIDRAIIVTPVLIFVTVMIHAGLSLMEPAAYYEQVVLSWGLQPARLTTGYDGPLARFGPLLSHVFLHAGWQHLIGNMFFLWAFGLAVEDRCGALRFLALYFGGAVAAAIAQTLVAPTTLVPMIGASGAVYAVMGAHLLLAPGAMTRVMVVPLVFIRFWIPTVILMLVYVGSQLAIVHYMPADGEHATQSVAHWAHLGGFFAGVLLAVPLGWHARHKAAFG